MSGALQAVYRNMRSFTATPAAPGSQSYTATGTYSWVVPAGVTKASVVIVGNGGNGAALGAYGFCCCSYTCDLPGGGGGGGGLAYKNNITVTPGASIAVNICINGGGRKNYFKCCSYLYAFNGNSANNYNGTCGGGGGGTVLPTVYLGGNGASTALPGLKGGNGGGGAAGYSGNGGNGAAQGSSGSNGAACSGAGGGGGGGSNYNNGGGGGGGVGIFGKTTTGAGGGLNSGGCAGSGGCNGSAPIPAGCGGTGGAGGAYGGGGGGQYGYPGATKHISLGAVGAVRIVWPGNTRSFPSTCVGAP